MKKLNEILGTEFPIIQGGMANIATGEFAAACSNAGALGLIAAGGLHSGEELREQIRICKSLTDKPFGVNLMLMNPAMDAFAAVVLSSPMSRKMGAAISNTIIARVCGSSALVMLSSVACIFFCLRIRAITPIPSPAPTYKNPAIRVDGI